MSKDKQKSIWDEIDKDETSTETEEEKTFEIDVEVKINECLLKKLNWLTRNYEYEIGGWLIGEFKNNEVIIEDILFPHQSVGLADVDTSAKALIKLRKEYGDKCLKIIGHWHSHNTMNNFWSSTDDTFISQYADVREKTIFIVSSKGNGHRIRLELRNPFKISVDCLNYEIIEEENNPLKEELNKIIKEKVTETKYNGYGSRGYGGYDINNNYTGNGSNVNDIANKVERMITYDMDTNTAEIIDLSWDLGNEIMSQFQDFKMELEHNYETFGNKIIVSFKDKEEADKQILEIAEFLIEHQNEVGGNYGY